MAKKIIICFQSQLVRLIRTCLPVFSKREINAYLSSGAVVRDDLIHARVALYRYISNEFYGCPWMCFDLIQIGKTVVYI